MWLLVLPPLGWAVQTSPVQVVRTYYVDPSVCRRTLPHFYEDAALSWSSFGCSDLVSEIRNAFDEWEHNSLVSFREVASTPADTVVAASYVPDESMIARVVFGQNRTSIEIDEGTCWYTDRDFCASIQRHEVLLWTLLTVGWVGSGALGVLLLCLPMRLVPATTRLANWAIFIASPLLLLFVMRPCLTCYDFRRTMMHEVGHTLGFMHTDDATRTQRCGCGADAVVCSLTAAAARETVMHSRARRTATACLSQQDADGLRSTYGGDCDAPVSCYETASFVGFSRIAVALVYGFLVSWGVVTLRHCLEPRARRYLHARRHVVVAAAPQGIARRLASHHRNHAPHPPSRRDAAHAIRVTRPRAKV